MFKEQILHKFKGLKKKDEEEEKIQPREEELKEEIEEEEKEHQVIRPKVKVAAPPVIE